MRGQPGFWDVDERYARLSEAGDPLDKLNAVVPWEVFRKPLGKALKRSDGARGGRPPYDAVLMFMCGRSLRCKGFLTAAVGAVHSCVRPVIAAHDRWP
jgi:hypothetical protein